MLLESVLIDFECSPLLILGEDTLRLNSIKGIGEEQRGSEQR